MDKAEEISNAARKIFRSTAIYDAFENPFGKDCYRWMSKNADNDNGIFTIWYKMKKYKFLSMFSFGKLHQIYKTNYKYYRNKMKVINSML